jgi:hypothetical protein
LSSHAAQGNQWSIDGLKPVTLIAFQLAARYEMLFIMAFWAGKVV